MTGNTTIQGYLSNQQSYADSLPTVDDPDKAYAGLIRDKFDYYMRHWRDYENSMIKNLDATPTEDRARLDAPMEAEKAKGIRNRNLARYGGAGLSVAQQQEQTRQLQRGNVLAEVNAINSGRLIDRDIQDASRNELMNLSLGLGRSNMSQLGSAAAQHQQRNQAFRAANEGYSNTLAGYGATAAGTFLATFGI